MKDEILASIRDRSIIEALPASVAGLGIAGSYSRGEESQYSDLDIFVLFDERSTHQYLESIDEFVSILRVPVVRRGPVPIPHFGDSVTLVYEDTSIVQVNFNTFDSIEINPMRANTDIIFDRTGKYQNLVLSSSTCNLDTSAIFREYADWFVIRSNFASRSLHKGELLRSTGYLHEMRIALVQLLRLVEGNFDERRNPFHPSSRFEESVDSSSASLIGRLFPTYSMESVRTVLLHSFDLFESLIGEASLDFRYDSKPTVALLASIRTRTRLAV